MKTTRVTILLSDSTIDPVKKSNLPLFLVRVFGQSTRESRDGKVGMHDTRPKENPRFRNMLARAISHPGNILPREARFLSTPSLTLPKKTDENTTSESRHFLLKPFFAKAAFLTGFPLESAKQLWTWVRDFGRRKLSQKEPQNRIPNQSD